MRGYIRKAEKYYMKEDCIEDVESNVICWNGEKIKINELRKSIHQLIKDCEILLYNELLYIYSNRLGAQVNVVSLKKDVRVKARGYWFRQNPKNQLD
jgi:hypothetical protein